MTDLPPGWEWTTVGEAGRVELGMARNPARHHGPNMRPYLRVANVFENRFDYDDVKEMHFSPEEFERYALRPGDILLNEGQSPELLGRPALYAGEPDIYAFTNSLIRFQAGPSVSPTWALLVFRHYMHSGRFTREVRITTNIAHLSSSRFKRIEFPVPPIVDQERLAIAVDDCLDRLEVASGRIKSARSKADAALLSINSAITEGRYTETLAHNSFDLLDYRRRVFERENGRDRRYKDPTDPDLQIPPISPTGWSLASLEAVTDPVRTIRYGILKPRSHGDGEVPYIEVRDLRDGLAGRTLRTTSRELDQLFEGSRVASGDVVLAVRGSYERSAVVPPEHHGANISRDVVRISPLEPLNPQWVHIFLQSKFARAYLNRNARGVAVKGVNVSSLRALPITFPSLEEQERLVEQAGEYASAIRQVDKLLVGAERSAASLRRAVLREAFWGRLAPRNTIVRPAPANLESLSMEPTVLNEPVRSGRPRLRDGLEGHDLNMSSTTSDARQLVDKLWSYCHVLRHDGVSTIDYVDQLTLLLFLKMADERANRPMAAERIVPVGDDWQALLKAKGDDLEKEYNRILLALAQKRGTIGRIFQKSQNKIRNAATLRKLVVDLINAQNWSGTKADIKGDAYETLLERGAEDVKSGAGQYFTPRALISAMVDCVQPSPDDTIIDPACGTGGFLLAANDYIQDHHGDDLTREQRYRLSNGAIRGIELVDGTARLAQMNLLLHGIGQASGNEKIEVRDALAEVPTSRATLVLANPPFGRKSGFTTVDEAGRITREDDSYARQDFWRTTTNKQLNFVQHIFTLLEVGGRAAVVVPDNVLFEGGAGEEIRRRLLKQCNVHTLLRLPTGIFYAGGVKANVLFFDKHQARDKPWTDQLWVYDFRVGQHFTLRQRQLTRGHLQDFVDSYRPGRPHSERVQSERFRPFTYDDLVARDKVNLDITWLRDPTLGDDAEALPPELIAQEILEDLQAALVEFQAVADRLAEAKYSQSLDHE